MKYIIKFVITPEGAGNLIPLEEERTVDEHPGISYGANMTVGNPPVDYKVGSIPLMQRIPDPDDSEKTAVIYWLLLLKPAQWEHQNATSGAQILSFGNTEGQEWRDIE